MYAFQHVRARAQKKHALHWGCLADRRSAAGDEFLRVRLLAQKTDEVTAAPNVPPAKWDGNAPYVPGPCGPHFWLWPPLVPFFFFFLFLGFWAVIAVPENGDAADWASKKSS